MSEVKRLLEQWEKPAPEPELQPVKVVWEYSPPGSEWQYDRGRWFAFSDDVHTDEAAKESNGATGDEAEKSGTQSALESAFAEMIAQAIADMRAEATREEGRANRTATEIREQIRRKEMRQFRDHYMQTPKQKEVRNEGYTQRRWREFGGDWNHRKYRK